MSRLTVLVAFLVHASCAYPAEPDPEPLVAVAPEHTVREGGMVTDQTITPAGHGFHQQFSALWHDKAVLPTARVNIAATSRQTDTIAAVHGPASTSRRLTVRFQLVRRASTCCD